MKKFIQGLMGAKSSHASNSGMSMQLVEARVKRKFDAAKLMSWVPVIMMVISIAAAYSTFLVIQKSFTRVESSIKHQVSIEKRPLEASAYQTVMEITKHLTPNIDMAASNTGDALTISIKSGQHYEEWLLAMNTLSARLPGVLWDAKYLCVGRCKGGVAVAVVTGVQQVVIAK